MLNLVDNIHERLCMIFFSIWLSFVMAVTLLRVCLILLRPGFRLC